MRRLSKTLIVSVVALSLVVASRGAGLWSDSSAPQSIQVSALARFPHETLSDWLSFADFVAEVTVAEIITLPVDDEYEGDENALQERRALVVVDSVVWRHETVKDNPNRIEFIILPNIVKDGKTISASRSFVPDVEVGARLLIPFVHTSGQGTFPLNLATMVPIQEGRLRPTTVVGGITSLLDGATLEEFDRLLAEAKPDQKAEANRDLDPDQRVELVLGKSEPNPFEGEE